MKTLLTLLLFIALFTACQDALTEFEKINKKAASGYTNVWISSGAAQFLVKSDSAGWSNNNLATTNGLVNPQRVLWGQGLSKFEVTIWSLDDQEVSITVLVDSLEVYHDSGDSLHVSFPLK